MTGDIKCPLCGSETRIRTRKEDSSKFYVCVNYPDCRGKVVYDDEWEDDDWGDEKPKQSEPTTVKTRFTDVTCPKCGSKTTIRTRGSQKFYVCVRYPKCKWGVAQKEHGSLSDRNKPLSVGLSILVVVIGIIMMLMVVAFAKTISYTIAGIIVFIVIGLMAAILRKLNG